MRKTKEANATYIRNLRSKYKKLGLCDLCGQKAVPGYIRCAAHLEYFKKYQQEYRKKSNKQKIAAAERRHRLANNGQCIWCKQSMTTTKRGGKICQLCRKKGLDSKKKLWEERLSLGLCKYCGKNEVTNIESDCCGVCRCKKVATNNLRDSKRWNDLKELFDRQNVCPYTGIQLILGVNATLDHISPKSKGGQDNIENLQWVYGGDDFDVNLMKGISSGKEFLQAIKILYNYNFK